METSEAPLVSPSFLRANKPDAGREQRSRIQRKACTRSCQKTAHIKLVSICALSSLFRRSRSGRPTRSSLPCSLQFTFTRRPIKTRKQVSKDRGPRASHRASKSWGVPKPFWAVSSSQALLVIASSPHASPVACLSRRPPTLCCVKVSRITHSSAVSV